MIEDIQWHPPFRGAVKIELSEYSDVLEYIDEKTLTKKPLLIDLLVIKKRTEKKIDNPIGNIFRIWNVMEYKSPTDYISIDDFYKVSAYAYLMKSDANTEDEIKFQDITVSFVSSKINRNLFKHLEDVRKYKKTMYVNGIYYFSKEGELPIQFITLEELDVQHKWLAGLTNQITKEMLYSLVKEYKEEEKNEYKEVILDTVLRANFEFVKKLKEEETMTMSKEVLELFQPELEEARIKGEIEGKIELVTVIKKKKEKGLDTMYIADILELEEEYVKEVMRILEQYPELSIEDVTRIIVEKNKKILA